MTLQGPHQVAICVFLGVSGVLTVEGNADAWMEAKGGSVEEMAWGEERGRFGLFRRRNGGSGERSGRTQSRTMTEGSERAASKSVLLEKMLEQGQPKM